MWHCTRPALVHARKQLSHPTQQHVLDSLRCFPLYLKYGLTPPLTLMPDTPFWTDDPAILGK
eukprot:2403420-Karenia_brevis.AAC.1